METAGDRTGRVFVLGSLVIACTVAVARLPQPGESLLGSGFLAEAGGKGFNQAVGAHRLGAAVDGVFAVGDDMFGTVARAALIAQGLDPGMIVRRDGATGAGVGMIGAHGENCIAVAPGVNAAPDLADGAGLAERIAAAAVTIAQFETADEPILRGFAAARAANALTILNPSPFRPIASAILSLTSLVLVNRTEAAALAETLECALDPSADAAETYRPLAERLAALGVAALVVTLAGETLIGWSNGVCVRQRAFAVTPVDATGAGDAFLAGLATALAFGHPFETGLRAGAGCGAIVASRAGVLAALPTSDALAVFQADTPYR